MSRFVSVARHDRVAVLRLERAEALNAISGAMADEIADVFRDVGRDDDVWALVVTAAGEKAFCVGADLKERGSFTLEDYHSNRKRIRGMFDAIRSLPQPSIAAPFGFALGGGFELVLSCDLAVAAEGTVMGLPEARVGLLPAGGGTQLLARKAGVSRAKEAIFTGARVAVEEWHRLGVVTKVVPRKELEAEALALAEEVCKSSPIAVRAAKRAIDAGLGRSLADGLEVEHSAWEEVIASEDREEGIAAFNEKRAPRWRNR